MTMTKKEALLVIDECMSKLAQAEAVYAGDFPEASITSVDEIDGKTVGVFVVVGKSRCEHIKAIVEDPMAGSIMTPLYDDGNGGLSTMKIVPPRPRPQDFDFEEDKWVEALFAWRDSL